MLTESRLRQIIRNIIAEGENEDKGSSKKLLSKFEACIKKCCSKESSLEACRKECKSMYEDLTAQEKKYLTAEIQKAYGKSMTYSDFVVTCYKKHCK